MIRIFHRAMALLDAADRRKVGWICLAAAAGAIVQALVILSLMPFIVMLTNPEMFDTHPQVRLVAGWLGIERYSLFMLLLGAAAALALTLGNLFVAAEHLFSYRFIERLTQRTSVRVLRRLLAQPWEHMGQRHAGMLGDLVTTQVPRVTSEVIGSGVALFSQLALLAFIVTLLLVLNPLTTLAALGALLLAYALLYCFTRNPIRAGGEAVTRVDAEVATTVKEAMDGAREIRVRGAEGFFLRRFERARSRALQLDTHFEFHSVMPHHLLEAVVFTGFIAVALFFLLRTDDAGMALSWLALYAFSVYRMVPALATAFDCAAEMQHNADAIQAIAPWCMPQPETAAPPLPPLRQSIRLEDISVRFAGRHQDQLEGVNLVIAAGTSVCLFGVSGAGKSTLLNLLAGLLEPQRGRLRVDGLPIDAARAPSWRAQLGYAPQSVYLFGGTLAANIAFGLEEGDIDLARVEAVATMANLQPLVARLPGGLQGSIGEHGALLSGGERQRIGIARALYTDPPVLLFDESFANLDAGNRVSILDRLFALPGRTLVFASHEREVVERCAHIVVVDRGRLIAQGGFDELLAGCPRFRELLAGAATAPALEGSEGTARSEA